MPIVTFDTHKFVRRMEQAGMPLEQAEAQAELFTEVIMVNLESLVTKEFMESRMDARFAEQDARIDGRFAEQKAYMDGRFAELQASLDARFRFLTWTQAIITAAVIIPYLERLAAL